MKTKIIKMVFLVLALLCMDFGVEAEHTDQIILMVVLVICASAFGIIGTFWK